jgi:hypothetical protein
MWEVSEEDEFWKGRAWILMNPHEVEMFKTSFTVCVRCTNEVCKNKLISVTVTDSV